MIINTTKSRTVWSNEKKKKALLFATVIFTALNLRSPIIGVGSLVDAMRADLEAVLARHLPAVREVVPERAADRWERIARLGVEADLFLASAGARAPLPWRPFVRAAFRAGPLAFLRFLSVSRVVPRTCSRLRAGLRPPSAGRGAGTPPGRRSRQDRP